eukprot:m.153674 g.153674  ORF g.153674 m.153674 type:complete len:1762 (-) comp16240_c6_seq2:45-5330(-)
MKMQTALLLLVCIAVGYAAAQSTPTTPTPTCEMLFGDSCVAPCVFNNATFSCHEPDQGGLCSDYDRIGCPARCFRDADTCRNLTCADLFTEVCDNPGYGLDCYLSEDINACVAQGDVPACSRYFNEMVCPTDRCNWSSDAFLCYEKGTLLPCYPYFYTREACNRQEQCTYSELYGTCIPVDGEPVCASFRDFLSCSDQPNCCHVDGICKDLVEGQDCNRELPVCSDYDAATCPTLCAQKDDQCVDIPCRERYNNRSCSARDDCAYGYGTCAPKGDLPCGQYSSSDTCPIGCEYLGQECVPRPCNYNANEEDCNMFANCTFVNSQCLDIHDSPSTPAPTEVFTGDCSTLTSQAACTVVGCVYNFAQSTCENAACFNFEEESVCSARNCTWDFFKFQCSAPDTGEPCSSYVRNSCPLNRCAFDTISSTCRDQVCTDLQDSINCKNSTLGCKYDNVTLRCYPSDQVVPCQDYLSQVDCPARCEYVMDAFICIEPGTKIPCSRFQFEQSCSSQPDCEFIFAINTCVNSTNPQYNCKAVYDRQFCRDSSICFLDETSGLCDDCTLENKADCIQPCPELDVPKCTQLNETDCSSNFYCSFNTEIEACEPSCYGAEKCACQSLEGCAFQGDTCGFVDDGLPCSSKTSSLACSRAGLRCTSDYSEGRFLCRDTVCADLQTESTCSSLGEGDTCEWLSSLGLCSTPGARVPCDRITDSSKCTSDLNCTFHSDINLCYFDDEDIPCARYSEESKCPTDRCVFYDLAFLCADIDEVVECRYYPNELNCITVPGCRWLASGGGCHNETEPAPCTSIYLEVGCNSEPGCKWDKVSCKSCDASETCDGSSALLPCEETQPCATQYCQINGPYCAQAPCYQIFLREYCDAVPECRYNIHAYQRPGYDACVPADYETPCVLFSTEFFCLKDNDVRNETCQWDPAYEVCYAVEDTLPCFAYTNQTVCDMRSDCIWSSSCEDYVTTTTTTTTTTTPYIDACLRRPCFPDVICTPGNVSDTYTCGACPTGYRGDGTNCERITCPSHLPLGSGATYLFGSQCFYPDYGTSCEAKCLAGYEMVAGDGVFTCGGNGTWMGQINCTDIKECEQDPSPCDPLTVCSEPAPNRFECTACPSGYNNLAVPPMTKCQDIDECQLNRCGSRRNCTNTPGSFMCGPCEPGWRETSPTSCENINECAEQNPCYPGVRCTDRIGSFTCASCPNGYVGDALGPNGCKPITCPMEEFPQYDNADVDCPSNNTFDSVCTVTCKPGYSISSTTVRCQANRAWTSPTLSCQKLPCTSQPSQNMLPENIVNPQCAGKFTCELQCKPGYHGVGDPVLTCPVTSWEANTSDAFSCVMCEPGVTYQASAGQTTCEAVRGPCAANTEYESKAPTISSNRVCAAVATKCSVGSEYSIGEPTPTSNRICDSCSSCPAGRYRSAGCDGLVDSVCAPCGTCGADEYVATRCSSLSNTICRTCPLGKYYDEGRDGCVDQPQCFVGWIEVVPAGPRQQRQCQLATESSSPSAGTVARLLQITLSGLNSTSTDISVHLQTLLVEAVRELYRPIVVRVGIIEISVSSEESRRRRSSSLDVTFRVEVDEADAQDLENTDTTPAAFKTAVMEVVMDASAVGVSAELRAAGDLLKVLNPEAASEAAVSTTTTTSRGPSSSSTARSTTTTRSSATTPQAATSDNNDSTLYIIIGAAAGGAVLVVVVIVVLCCCSRSKRKGANISGEAYQENTYSDMTEMMAMKTLETTAKAPTATRATRQGSFYSSITKVSSEI